MKLIKKFMPTKIKVTIMSVLGSVIWESEKETIKEAVVEKNKRDANLYGANLRGANLRGATDKTLPQDYINQCSRDILFILGCLKNEVPALKAKLLAGEVDGIQYKGDCACLVGTLAKSDGGLDKVCSMIPFYEKGTHNPGEAFFLNIHVGDKPDNSWFVAHAVKLCDMVIDSNNLWLTKKKAGRKSLIKSLDFT